MTDDAIHRIPTDSPRVFAFRIRGKVTAEDMSSMATTMNQAFDADDDVSILLIFDRFEGSEAGAALDWEAIKAQFRSLAKVDKYAVVGAPSSAATMIETFDTIIPVDARVFEAEQRDQAWAFVGARPVDESV